ncbi:uncharacterized protein [Physcomitrium patens]|uniref:uncharacterized protein isoform X4 n=1 Tax=Physcomitrium patens TaxID=3218 RepID=UPI003CCE052A
MSPCRSHVVSQPSLKYKLQPGKPCKTSMYFKRIKMAGAALEIGDIRSSQQPQWFTPNRGEFGLTSLQDGILSSAFMAGRLAASPVFAHLAEFCLPIIMFISYCLCCSAR